MVDLAFATINVVTGVTLILLISANHELHVRLNRSIRLGLWFGAVGLLAQSMRTFSSVFLGHYPLNNLPVWMLKDVGYWLLIVGLIKTWMAAQKNKKGES